MNLKEVDEDVLKLMAREAADTYGLAMIENTKNPTENNKIVMDNYRTICDTICKEINNRKDINNNKQSLDNQYFPHQNYSITHLRLNLRTKFLFLD